MTKDEFLYDHDLDSIYDLISRENDFNNMKNNSKYESKYSPNANKSNVKNNTVMRATDFL